jgi:predicted DNA-binding transcriptional regulator YafY
MPRNQEVIRQWKLVHALEGARHGASIDDLARDLEVTTRTIRRDLAALQEAGFPLYDDRDEQGRTRWRLDGHALKHLDTGFTLGELCALYLGRHVLETAAGTPFGKDLAMAFERIEKMLSPRMRAFLDQMPAVLTSKTGPRAAVDGERSGAAAQLLEAALHHRVARMRYHSVSSAREKDYVVHPQRLAFAQGELYLLAFVPEYRDTRTFALSRVTSVSLDKQTFTPRDEPDDGVFANSLGVHTGPTAPVEVRFDASVAPHVRARIWHPSQHLAETGDGGVTLSMEVCHDWALRSWILSWGPLAQVVAPASLAREIRDDHTAASTRYSTPHL